MNKPRVLTHDEMKASEAAFRGRPFNQKWSKAARRVYDGLLGVLDGATPIVTPDIAPLPEGELTDMTVEMLNELEPESVVLSDSDSFGGGETALFSPPNHITSREDAVKAGLVVDVTQVAKHLGCTFPSELPSPCGRKASRDPLRYRQNPGMTGFGICY